MWTSLLFRFFQVEQPGLITPAWVNANWIQLLCEAGTRVLQCKNCVWGGNKIQCMRRGDLHAIITCCLEKREKTKEKAWPIDAAIGISADWKHPHKGQVQNKSLGSRFGFLKTSGPNSDRPYTEIIREEQLLETTALLFERLRIFVRHTCKPLSKTTCNARVWSHMLLSTNGGFGNDRVSCWEKISFFCPALNQKKNVDFYADMHTKVQTWNWL